MTFPKTFIIHLASATAREPQVARLAAHVGSSAEVLSAVDGALLSEAEYAKRMGPTSRPRYPFALRQAEVATFLSHRAAWQRIVAENLDAALILEDDVALDTEFDKALALSQHHLREGAFLRFPVQNREVADVVVAEERQVRIVRPKIIGLGMQAQLVSRAAAKRLLEVSETFDRPVDTFVQARWLHQAELLSVWPSGVREVSSALGGSLIGENKNLSERLVREICRPIYRAQVAFWSR